MGEGKDSILVIEDSEITLYKVKAILIRLGYDVIAYNNPVAALEWLFETPSKPDLLISDINMPGIDGYEFARRVRATDSTKGIPILMLTSHMDTRDKIEGLESGADDFLSKTVGVAELELRVKALIARKHSGSESIDEISAQTISVFSLRGGVGVSSISVNLAVAIAQLWGIESTLWDMAMGVGQCSLMMNMKPTQSITSLSNWHEKTLDDATLHSFMLKHLSGVWLLPAPLSIEEVELINTKTIDMIWTGIQSVSPYLIIDAGNHFTEPSLAVLERSDLILLVLTPELASINATYQALKVFSEMGFADEKIMLVLNHTNHINSFSKEKISESLRKPILAEIPPDERNMIKSINQGSPYLRLAPRSETSLAIAKLAYRISATKMEPKGASRSELMLDNIRKTLIEK